MSVQDWAAAAFIVAVVGLVWLMAWLLVTDRRQRARVNRQVAEQVEKRIAERRFDSGRP